METRLFDYDLPPGLIAQVPVEPRDASRLMVVHRASGEIEHRIFRQVSEYLGPGDLLVLNQTRVIRARLFGYKVPSGGRVELLLLSRRDARACATPVQAGAGERTWEVLARGKGLRPGTAIELQPVRQGGQSCAPRLAVEVLAKSEADGWLVRFSEPIEPWLEEMGAVPLPPYIHQPLADAERYQTVYGRIEGSVAASTAGLHFTPELLADLQEKGIEMAFLTLHIGLDTFRPVREEQVEEHRIHSEWYDLPASVAGQINRARQEGRRVIAVGTTVVRSLESAAASAPQGQSRGRQTVSAYAGPTDLFIYPGYRFRVVDAMITNFHLPRSTLLMLVSAFAGRELILRAYEEAIGRGYRFFSFGDAMLLV